MENTDQDENLDYPQQDNQQPETVNDPNRGIDLYTIPLQLTFNESTSKTDLINRIVCGDCEKILKDFPDNSVDLIITSPPYADQRDATYGGIKPDQYVSWFMTRADQCLLIIYYSYLLSQMTEREEPPGKKGMRGERTPPTHAFFPGF